MMSLIDVAIPVVVSRRGGEENFAYMNVEKGKEWFVRDTLYTNSFTHMNRVNWSVILFQEVRPGPE